MPAFHVTIELSDDRYRRLDEELLSRKIVRLGWADGWSDPPAAIYRAAAYGDRGALMVAVEDAVKKITVDPHIVVIDRMA